MGNETEVGESRTLAEAFLRKPVTTREAIAADLGVGEDLPDRHPEASIVILKRIAERGLVDDLRVALFGRRQDGEFVPPYTVDDLDHTQPGWTSCQNCWDWDKAHVDGRCTFPGCDCTSLVILTTDGPKAVAMMSHIGRSSDA